MTTDGLLRFGFMGLGVLGLYTEKINLLLFVILVSYLTFSLDKK